MLLAKGAQFYVLLIHNEWNGCCSLPSHCLYRVFYWPKDICCIRCSAANYNTMNILLALSWFSIRKCLASFCWRYAFVLFFKHFFTLHPSPSPSPTDHAPPSLIEGRPAVSRGTRGIWIWVALFVVLAVLLALLASLMLQPAVDAAPVGTGDSWMTIQQLLWPYTGLRHNAQPPVWHLGICKAGVASPGIQKLLRLH